MYYFLILKLVILIVNEKYRKFDLLLSLFHKNNLLKYYQKKNFLFNRLLLSVVKKESFFFVQFIT